MDTSFLHGQTGERMPVCRYIRWSHNLYLM